MRTKPFLDLILREDALTRGLDDEEARVLIEWLADWTERLVEKSASEDEAHRHVEHLRRRGRAIGRFVHLWCWAGQAGAACQLAAVERFGWPLPEGEIDPCDLMVDITRWESRALRKAG